MIWLNHHALFSISFSLIFARLQKERLTRAAASRKLLLRYGIGHVIYPPITLAGWFHPPLMLPMHGAVVSYYFGPGYVPFISLGSARDTAPSE